MRFQDRDREILRFVSDNDGVVAVDQLHRKFWREKTLRAVQKRLQKLCAADFLARPTLQDYRTNPIPKSIVWLGWRGILSLAEESGVVVDPPKNPAVENQLKLFERELRKQGICWVRQPSWGKLSHDLKVIDFRLTMEEAVSKMNWLHLVDWVSESTFRSDMDQVTFARPNKDGVLEAAKRGVVPDGYFVIADDKRRSRGEPFMARYLLELDMANHSTPSFGRDKVLPYAAYIKSPQYLARTGSNAGRWLIVTTGERRLKNLMSQTKRILGTTKLFYFTTFESFHGGNLLRDPVWQRLDRKESQALLSGQGQRIIFQWAE